MKNKHTTPCPVCRKPMIMGKVDNKVVAMCENKKCESVLVFGDPIQKMFGLEPKP